MKNKINKMAAVFIASIFALSGLGVAYAAWTDTITITGDVTTGVVEWEFWTDPYWQDDDAPNGDYLSPPHDKNVDPNLGFFDENGNLILPYDAGKNVAWGTAVKIDDHLIEVALHDAYPGYWNHLLFSVHCLGTIPLKINDVLIYVDLDEPPVAQITISNEQEAHGVDLDGVNGDDIQIMWGDNFGYQMHYCYWKDISLQICVLQPAPQNSELTFYMLYRAVQWNEYPHYAIP